MKLQINVRSLLLCSASSILLVFCSVTSVLGVKLPNVEIPATGYKDSLPFTVSDTGTLSLRIRLRVNTPFGIPFLGESQYSAELRKVGGTSALVTATGKVTATFETVVLTLPISDCAKTGSYFIRLRNSGEINKQGGEAEFPEFTPPTARSTSAILARFGVTQGNTIPIGIPSALEPAGNSGGRLRITATWDSICFPDAAGCMLKYQLIRNGSAFGASVKGYAHNALFGNAAPKMTLDVNLAGDQVSGDWSLQIQGDSRGNVSNVQTTVKFTPRCTN